MHIQQVVSQGQQVLLSQVEMTVKTVRAVGHGINVLSRTRPMASPREAVAEILDKIDTVLLIDSMTLSLPWN